MWWGQPRVTTFEECFPPLRPEWRPKPESKVKAYLAGGKVVLQGRHTSKDVYVARADGVAFRVVKSFEAIGSGQQCKA